jgi:pantetheine-phosphate adenylyltransferase
MGKWGQDMALERVGVYPGTFDPVTSGHMEVIRRSLRLVDKLVIGPATNIGKGPLFSLQERIDIIKDDIADFSETDKARIQIAPFDGLLIHFAREVGASVIIRGLRAVSDFEYEIQMANMNARMEPNIETIFLMASDRHQFIASSLVKDIARLGGDTSQFVSKKVFQRLKDKFKKS